MFITNHSNPTSHQKKKHVVVVYSLVLVYKAKLLLMLMLMTTLCGMKLYLTHPSKLYYGLKLYIIKDVPTLSDEWVPSPVAGFSNQA